MSAVEILDNREPVLEPAKRRGLALVPRGDSAPAQFATSRSDSSDTKVPLKTWLAVFGSALGAFMAILDIQIVNASLPEIQGAIGAGIDDGAWISTSYLVAEIVVIPLTAWLSQAFSVRRYMIVNAALFVAFSLACAFATTLPQMIVLRALQGFTGGVLIPLAFTVVVTSLPKSKQPIGMALFGLSVTFAPAIGPTIGGYLTENYGWEYIFYINLLPGTAMIALLWLSLAKVPMRLRLLREGDWLGILTMAIGLGALQTALEEGNKDDWFGSPFIVRLSVIAAIALPLFVCVELWKKKPLLNLRLLMRRNFGLGTTANFLLGMALYGSVFILPLYLSQMQGYNAEQIGEVMMWYGLPQLLIIPLVPKLMQRIDARLMLGFGAAMFAASAFLNINLSSDYSGPQFIWPNIVRAFGQAILLAPLAGIATAGIEVENVGSASALFNMMRNLGGAIGIAGLQTFLTKREQYHSNVITSQVSLFAEASRARIDKLTQYFLNHGIADTAQAKHEAIVTIGRAVHRQAYFLGYGDTFLLLGIALAIAALAIAFMKKPEQTLGGAGAH
ncbi:MAG: MDR family MFS transporter [Alphaproteobacteria bacterium]